MLDPRLHERIARALGWTVQETQSMSLPALREVVRHTDPSLAEEIGQVVERGEHVTTRSPFARSHRRYGNGESHEQMLERWKREQKEKLATERELAEYAGIVQKPERGQEVLIEAHGKTAILKRSQSGRRNDYALNMKGGRDPVPGPAYSWRFGTWPQILAEVGHFKLYGSFQPVDWANVPH